MKSIDWLKASYEVEKKIMIGKRVMFLLILGLVIPLTGCAKDKHVHEAASGLPEQIVLTPELKTLLIQEMIAVQKGMMELIPAMATADWHVVAEVGDKLRDSFIMKQQLSDEQIHELHTSLPALFQEMDHSFHDSAGMLSHAAKAGNAELVNFYFYKLNEACIQCHTKFASHRFPAFSNRKKMEHNH